MTVKTIILIAQSQNHGQDDHFNCAIQNDGQDDAFELRNSK